jgi:glutamate synthase (NADPH/NADH) large chain
MPTIFPSRQGLYDPTQEKDSCGIGFVCDIKGRPSNQILRDAEQMNCCMDHRGGVGFETNTGDGAGILTGLPHKLLKTIALQEFTWELPEPGRYGAGIVFMPVEEADRQHCMAVVEGEIKAQGLELVGWRELPIDADAADLGVTARAAMPFMMQLIVSASGRNGQQSETPTDRTERFNQDALERKLYLIRKYSTNSLRQDQQLSSSATF